MKITASSDWRDAIAFDTPMVVADLVPGDAARCAACGGESAPRPRTELWAIKHRHPKHHGGYVRFYCREHLPVIQQAAAPADDVRRGSAAPRAARRPAARRSAPAVEREAAKCPDCFVEIPATGICGMCGQPAG